MVSLTALWLPILASAVLVFVMSSIVHMALGYHKTDYKSLPDEEAARAALGKQNLPPGQYHVPYCADMKKMAEPDMVKKYEEGPVAFITIFPRGRISMGPYLAKWFLFCVFISFMVAYLTGRVLTPGVDYLHVFRVAGTTAWLGYAGSSISAGIWLGKPWSTVLKDVFDGLLYAGMTAGAFGWLWPKA